MKDLQLTRRGFARTSAAALAGLYMGGTAQTASAQGGGPQPEPAPRPFPQKDPGKDAIVELVDYCLQMTYDRLPPAVIEISKQQILDTIGVGLAGHQADGARQLREFTASNAGRPESHIWGTAVRVPVHEAVRVNGTMAHALDYDDTHEKSYVHPSVITIPAVLAVAENTAGIIGKDMIVAVALGTDISCRLAMAGQPGVDPFEVGWHNTTVNGYISSALCAGKLLGLNRDEMIHAAGIAYHQAAGNAQAHVDGALTKRMGPGFAGSAGVLAAQMARSGITGARGVLEGPVGLYHQYHHGHYDRDILVSDFGTRFATIDLSFKPYPSCRGSHTAVDAALAVLRNHEFAVDDIQAITIFNGPGEYGLLGDPIAAKRRPQTNVEAQFSNPWVVATTLHNGEITLEDFKAESLKRPEILALTSKMNTALDKSLVTQGGGVGPTRLDVTLKDGRRITETILAAKGEPNQPLSPSEFEQKFRDCTRAAGLDERQVSLLISTVQSLETLSNPATLTTRMTIPQA